jgi:hypothetical protein
LIRQDRNLSGKREEFPEESLDLTVDATRVSKRTRAIKRITDFTDEPTLISHPKSPSRSIADSLNFNEVDKPTTRQTPQLDRQGAIV